MAVAIRLDLSSRYAQAFGVIGAYALSGLPGFYGNVKTFKAETPRRLSKMGTPIFDEVIFRDPKSPQSLPYRIELPVLMRCGQTKIITRTPITGGKGEIIESFGLQAYNINIKGLLVDMDDHKRPFDQIEKLNNLFQEDKVFNVESDELDAMGIGQIYFKSIDFTPLDGFRDTESFTLNAYAYEEVDFYLQNTT